MFQKCILIGLTFFTTPSMAGLLGGESGWGPGRCVEVFTVRPTSQRPPGLPGWSGPPGSGRNAIRLARIRYGTRGVANFHRRYGPRKADQQTGPADPAVAAAVVQSLGAVPLDTPRLQLGHRLSAPNAEIDRLLRIVNASEVVQYKRQPDGTRRYTIQSRTRQIDVLPGTFEFMVAVVAKINSWNKVAAIPTQAMLLPPDIIAWFENSINTVLHREMLTPVHLNSVLRSLLTRKLVPVTPRNSDPDVGVRWLQDLAQVSRDQLQPDVDLDVLTSVFGREPLKRLYVETIEQLVARAKDPTRTTYVSAYAGGEWSVSHEINGLRLRDIQSPGYSTGEHIDFMSQAQFVTHVEALLAGHEVAPNPELFRRLGAFEIAQNKYDLWQSIYWFAYSGQKPLGNSGEDALSGFQSFLDAMGELGYNEAAARAAVNFFRARLDRPKI